MTGESVRLGTPVHQENTHVALAVVPTRPGWLLYWRLWPSHPISIYLDIAEYPNSYSVADTTEKERHPKRDIT